jgi:flavin-dependent dehydrogenase
VLDLIVAGAGPAGLATALYASQAGLQTVVLDPRPGPIDKACGEGLMPAAVRALSALGVDPPGTALRGIRYVDGDRSAQAVFGGSAGRGVRRTDLHAALVERARAAGVRVVRGSVDAISQDATSVRAGDLTARYLAAADGLHSPIRRALHLDVSGPRRHLRWGLRQHFAVAPWTDLVEVHWSPSTEAYVTPVADHLIGVALLSGTRGGFAEHLCAFPQLAARLPSTGATSVRGAGPLRQSARRRVVGRVLFVGDAAGYVDALTGEGIAVALKSARALVRCVLAEQPQHYEREWAAASRNYRAITASLLWAGRRRALRPAIVPLAGAAPVLFRAAVHQLAR